MTDKNQNICKIRRPGLLLQAARIAAGTYRRDRDLHRLLKTPQMLPQEKCFQRLTRMEDEMDQARRDKISTYSISRHVELLAALLVEMRHRYLIKTA